MGLWSTPCYPRFLKYEIWQKLWTLSKNLHRVSFRAAIDGTDQQVALETILRAILSYHIVPKIAYDLPSLENNVTYPQNFESLVLLLASHCALGLLRTLSRPQSI